MSNPSAHRRTLTLPKGGSEAEKEEAICGLISAAASGFHYKLCDCFFFCACLPNLFLPRPAKEQEEKGGEKKDEEQSKTVEPDSLTGNVGSFWPLDVTAWWTGSDKTRHEEEWNDFMTL